MTGSGRGRIPRPLPGLAYRLLGSACDAEDVLRSAFERWMAAEGAAAPERWLTTVVGPPQTGPDCWPRKRCASTRRGPSPRHPGANLARLEISIMLRELLTRVPDITAGEPDRLLSSFVNGIKRLPCEFIRGV